MKQKRTYHQRLCIHIWDGCLSTNHIIHDGLCECWLVHFIVATFPVTYKIHDHVLLELELVCHG